MASIFVRLPLLVVVGMSILLVGTFGDLAYHLFGLVLLAGSDGYRAHLITFAGMLISVLGLLVRAVQTR